MSSEKGFGVVTLLVLLPLLLSLLLGLFSAGEVLNEWNRLRHLCQSSAIKHQNDLRRSLLQLLRLNPQAQSLRRQESVARTKLALALASKNPLAIARAQKALHKIRERQRLLDLQQKTILKEARTKASGFKLQLRRSPETKTVALIRSSASPSYPMALSPKPPHGLAPEYLVPHDFSDRQNLGLIFSKSLPLSRKLNIECGATLKFTENKWHSLLNEAKPSSKSSESL